MTILTNPKSMIYRNLYENTDKVCTDVFKLACDSEQHYIDVGPTTMRK